MNRYDSFTYPQAGFQLHGRLSLSKIGDIKVKLHRPIQSLIATHQEGCPPQPCTGLAAPNTSY